MNAEQSNSNCHLNLGELPKRPTYGCQRLAAIFRLLICLVFIFHYSLPFLETLSVILSVDRYDGEISCNFASLHVHLITAKENGPISLRIQSIAK